MLKQATLSLKEALLGLTPVEPEEEDDTPKAADSSPSFLALPLHRAAFANDATSLRRLLDDCPAEARAARDAHGNSALHVAVLRHASAAIEALLAGGLSPETRNSRKWSPLDEAVALRDREAVKLLLTQLRLDVKRERKALKVRLQVAMRALPDFSLQMRWELGSPLFGLLLRRYAPDDTYFLHKCGLRLRVDGSLRGLDPHSRSLLPRWKRGPFSLLVDASQTPVSAALADHTDGTFIDLYRERKQAVCDLDADVDALLEAGAGRVGLKGSALGFEPARSWLGRAVTATVEGHQTQLFEMAGRMVAVVKKKAAIVVPPGSTFEQYLAMKLPPDEVEEIPWDPLRAPPPTVAQAFAADAEASEELAAGGGAAARRAAEKGRWVRGRCWMARDFPISLRHLLPLLEAAGDANRHLAAAASLVAEYSEKEQFPVRLEVPLMWTVYLALRFRGFRELGASDAVRAPAFFSVPPAYRCIQLAEVLPAEAEGQEAFYDAREA